MKPDRAMLQHVEKELQWDPVLRGAGIGVVVRDGVVTLTGTVNSYSRRLAAEHAARRVQGIKDVKVDILIRRPSDFHKTDAEIADAARRALRWHSFFPEEQITASVENGWVTLHGEVEWHVQRETAVNAVQYIMGVQGVTNSIVLKPRVTAVLLRNVIRQALAKRADVEAEGISMLVRGGKVTLRGRVSSHAIRSGIAVAVAGVPGVTGVENELVVAL